MRIKGYVDLRSLHLPEGSVIFANGGPLAVAEDDVQLDVRSLVFGRWEDLPAAYVEQAAAAAAQGPEVIEGQPLEANEHGAVADRAANELDSLGDYEGNVSETGRETC